METAYDRKSKLVDQLLELYARLGYAPEQRGQFFDLPTANLQIRIQVAQAEVERLPRGR